MIFQMKRSLVLTTDPIEESSLVAGRLLSEAMGAVVYFSGVVRGTEGTTSILGIHYEAFAAMAEHQFNLLFDEIANRWPVESIRLVHRLGWVRVNEVSLWVEVVAAHRSEAFAASQYLIDEMKKRVPIWKRTR